MPTVIITFDDTKIRIYRFNTIQICNSFVAACKLRHVCQSQETIVTTSSQTNKSNCHKFAKEYNASRVTFYAVESSRALSPKRTNYAITNAN